MPCSVPHQYTWGVMGKEQPGFISLSMRNKPWLDWPRQTLACPPACHRGQGWWGQAKCWPSAAEPMPFPTQARFCFSNMQLQPGLAGAVHRWRQDFLLGLAWLLPFGWESWLAADRLTPDQGCPEGEMRPLSDNQGLPFLLPPSSRPVHVPTPEAEKRQVCGAQGCRIYPSPLGTWKQEMWLLRPPQRT